MKLYIIRHADPDYANNTITEFGWQEAHALSDWLKDVHIDKIYSSPLGRALDTASPTCKKKGMELVILPWTEESMEYMQRLEYTDNCSYKFSPKEGVHDYVDFADHERMSFIDGMVKSSDEFLASMGYERHGAFYKITAHNEQAIAIFCHGGFGSAWINHLLGMAPAAGWHNIALCTSSVTTVEFNNSESGYTRPVLRHLGEVHHIRMAGLRINNR